ncbi:hypothetical protein MTR67_011928, partial [Solanum verrucosum]
VRCRLFEEESLVELRDRGLAGDSGKAALDSDGVLRFVGWLSIPRVEDLIQLIFPRPMVLCILSIWALLRCIVT